jgi:predicted phage gp36 major capsid-like protein
LGRRDRVAQTRRTRRGSMGSTASRSSSSTLRRRRRRRCSTTARTMSSLWLAKKVAQKLAKTENTGFVSGNGITSPEGVHDSTPRARRRARRSPNLPRRSGRSRRVPNGDIRHDQPGRQDHRPDSGRAERAAWRGCLRYESAHRRCETRKLKDGDGNYLFIPDFSKNPNGTILGYARRGTERHGRYRGELAFGWLRKLQGIIRGERSCRRHAACCVIRSPTKPNVIFYTTKRVGGDVVNFQGIVLLKFG